MKVKDAFQGMRVKPTPAAVEQSPWLKGKVATVEGKPYTAQVSTCIRLRIPGRKLRFTFPARQWEPAVSSEEIIEATLDAFARASKVRHLFVGETSACCSVARRMGLRLFDTRDQIRQEHQLQGLGGSVTIHLCYGYERYWTPYMRDLAVACRMKIIHES